MSRELPSAAAPIQSTAGAIPVRNEKGEFSMQKVKVVRYVAGRRPDYAANEGSDSESGEETDFKPQFGLDSFKGSSGVTDDSVDSKLAEDPKWRRLQRRAVKEEDEEERPRRVAEPTVLARGGRRGSSPESRRRRRSDSVDSAAASDEEKLSAAPHIIPRSVESSGDEEDVGEEELERRRQQMRMKAKTKVEEELLAPEEEVDSGEESGGEESEYEEYTDSEEDTGPRLKPVFVRKRDRITLQETEKEELRIKELQLEQRKLLEERKKQSVKLVEELVRTEIDQSKKSKEDKVDLNAVCTDDENEELAYEAWKLRELKRIKREKDTKEANEKDKQELDRIHNMTEEERRAYLRANPKVVTNKAVKGKYKFLQKYYHRGAYFLDEEEDVLKRDVAQPTLEDQFDKTVLPKVMQVKNFGKAGRTKYTHLVDQDTTDFNSPWQSDTTNNIKFFNKHAGGVKEVFTRPSLKKRKKN